MSVPIPVLRFGTHLDAAVGRMPEATCLHVMYYTWGVSEYSRTVNHTYLTLLLFFTVAPKIVI